MSTLAEARESRNRAEGSPCAPWRSHRSRGDREFRSPVVLFLAGCEAANCTPGVLQAQPGRDGRTAHHTHRTEVDFEESEECGASRRPPPFGWASRVCLFFSLLAVSRQFSQRPSCPSRSSHPRPRSSSSSLLLRQGGTGMGGRTARRHHTGFAALCTFAAVL